MAKNKGAFLYKVMQPILKVIFKAYYNPSVINKEYIPVKGKAVIAGNHKHALDPILVDICTTRVVHTLAKKIYMMASLDGFSELSEQYLLICMQSIIEVPLIVQLNI